MTTNTKRILIALMAVVVLAALAVFAACDKTPELPSIVGVKFEDKTVSYDGNEHEITVSGELPDGATVEYRSNKATAVGQYIATAIVRCEGYRTLVLDAKLTITSLPISGVTFEDKTVSYDGNEHEITIDGNLPTGVSVVYSGNKGKEVGVYTATARLSGNGFDTLTLTAKLTISKADIIGVTFNDKTVSYDGNEHVVTIDGVLPQGVNVTYADNAATAAGEYEAQAILSGTGYQTLTLTAKLIINEVPYTLVENAEQLLEATQQGGLILLANDITLENGDFISITKNTSINGFGHTVTAVNYSNSDYRVIDLNGDDCKNVTICNLNIVAQKSGTLAARY